MWCASGGQMPDKGFQQSRFLQLIGYQLKPGQWGAPPPTVPLKKYRIKPEPKRFRNEVFL